MRAPGTVEYAIWRMHLHCTDFTIFLWFLVRCRVNWNVTVIPCLNLLLLYFRQLMVIMSSKYFIFYFFTRYFTGREDLAVVGGVA